MKISCLLVFLSLPSLPSSLPYITPPSSSLSIIIYVTVSVWNARWPHLIGKVHCASLNLLFLTFLSRDFLSDRSQSFSARPRGDTQFQRLSQQSSSTSQLQSDPSQTDYGGHGSNSTITSSAGGSSGGIAGSPQLQMSLEGIGEHTSTPQSEMKHGKQKSSQPNARSESYKECSPKRSRTNRPKSDPSLYEWEKYFYQFFVILIIFKLIQRRSIFTSWSSSRWHTQRISHKHNSEANSRYESRFLICFVRRWIFLKGSGCVGRSWSHTHRRREEKAGNYQWWVWKFIKI